MGRRPRRSTSNGQRGQASGEYLGVILLVSVIIAAVVLAAPGLGIDTRLKELICQIGGGSCQEEQTADAGPCVVSTNSRDAGLNLQIVAVDVETGGSYLREDRSDGTTVFTVTDDASIAAALRAGAKLKAGNFGFDATAEASAGGRLEGAKQYTVPTADAEDLEEVLSKEGSIGKLVRDGAEAGSGLAAPLVDGALDWAFGEDEPPLPETSSEYLSAEFVASAGAEASVDGGPLGGTGIEAALEAAGGGRLITSGENEGDVELYIQLDASAAGNLSVATLGPSLSGETSGVAKVTLEDGTTPTSLDITLSAGYEGALNIGDTLEGAQLGDLAGILEEASISGSSGEGQSIEFGASLDLTDPANAEAAAGLLTQGAAGAPDLVERFATDGTLTLQTADTSSDSNEFGANLGAGVNGGGGFDTSESESETTTAFIRPGGAAVGGFQVRECG